MKALKLIPLFLITIVVTWFCAIRYYNYVDSKIPVIYEAQCLPMPDYYRRITGFDSLQAVFFMDKLDVNFCYPNKWEFEITLPSATNTIDTPDAPDADSLIVSYPKK